MPDRVQHEGFYFSHCLAGQVAWLVVRVCNSQEMRRGKKTDAFNYFLPLAWLGLWVVRFTSLTRHFTFPGHLGYLHGLDMVRLGDNGPLHTDVLVGFSCGSVAFSSLCGHCGWLSKKNNRSRGPGRAHGGSGQYSTVPGGGGAIHYFTLCAMSFRRWVIQ